MKDLDTFVKENRTFIKIKSGEVFTGIYKGYAIVADSFNPGKEKVAYKFQDPADKIVRSWNCGRTDVAEEMKKVALESVVKISRTGATPKDTKYTIEVQVPF